MNSSKNINPHCHICKEQLKLDEVVVLDGTLKGIIHAECNNLPQEEIEDRGSFQEVISRNQLWLKQFNHMILH
ncbi:hypothetical protein [Cytobacillus firmus]|uniref:Uncharacterized protein n=1 Tax=Cytobacillus firmus DS1 TaxID=1307436 RepID=W7LI12_CYTFI|nr:hypothetical protein [Cytobacillus firmus]EWG11694.1 hypothetical protein PBF_06166 [Cytobacillus firmus DS1]